MKRLTLSLFVLTSIIIVEPTSLIAKNINDVISDTTSISRIGLKGKIRQIKEFIYNAYDDFGVIKTGSMAEDKDFIIEANYKSNRCYSFDLKGRNTQVIEYYNPTSISVTRTMSYIGNRLTNIEGVYRFSDGIRKTKLLFSYNEKNQIITETAYGLEGQLTVKYQYKYDRYNNIVWQRAVDGDGDIMYTNTGDFRYDANGQLVYSKVCDENLNDTVVKQNRYDGKKRVQSTAIYGTSTYNTSYEYDDNDRLIKETSVVTFTDGHHYEITSYYSYNDEGKLKLIKIVSDDGSTREEKFEGNTYEKTSIDKNGKLEYRKIYKDKLLVKYESGDNTYEYEYKFDDKGNWVKAIEKKNSVATYVKIRSILYY